MPSIYISKQSGKWSDVSTWSIVNNASVGQTSTFTMSASSLSPVANATITPQSLGWDKIIIAPGHVVEYDVIGSFGDGGSLYLNAGASTLVSVSNQLSGNAIYLSGGVLKADRNLNTGLTAIGSICVGNQAELDWGNSLNPLSAVTSNITLSGRWAYNSIIYALGIVVNSELYWNKVTFWGKAKTRNTTLISTLSTSSASSTFVADATNWNVGDTLALQSYNHDPANSNILTITGLTGNFIQFSPSINASAVTTRRTSGFRISNLSSNVNLNSISVSNPQQGLLCQLNFGSPALYQLGYLTVENLGNNTAWGAALPTGNTNGNTGTTIAALAFYTGYPSSPVILESVAIYTKHTASTLGNRAGIMFWGWNSEEHLCNNLAFYDAAASGTCFAVYYNTGAYARVNNACIYRCTNGVHHNSFAFQTSLYNSYVCGSNTAIGSLTNGLKIYAENSELRANSTPILFDGVQDFKLVNCILGGNNSANAVIAGNDKATGTVIASNATILTGIPALQVPTGNPIFYANLASVNFYQLSGNRLDYRTYNTNYNGTLDFNVRKNGIRSLKLRLDRSSYIIPYYKSFSGFEGVPQIIKGNIRFDSNYGSTPITVSVEGGGVSILSSIPITPNTWHPVEFNFTPTFNSDMLFTVSMYTTATTRTANVWLDGFLLDPFIDRVRHYGYVFDNLFDRTINPLNTLSENQVSALGEVSNLDYLYDAATYWSTANPGVSSYFDLFSTNGTTLDFGNKNFIINNFGTGFLYSSATNTITLDAPSLSAGTNFNTLKTTGTITLSTGIISNIDIDASVVQNTPTNLNTVYMLNNARTFTYNTNSPIEVEYTDCNIYGLKNDGTAIVTVKKSGSTSITEYNGDDPEIKTYLPTLINLTLGTPDKGYIALYDNSSIRRYYQNTEGTIVLPASATGTWSYKVARYGYELFSGSFSVNPNVGGIIDINPNYVSDTFITVTSASVVSAYTDLNSTEKIHDYVSYIRTTSEGIDYGPLHSQSFGTLSFNSSLTLNASAASVFDYTGGVITLKSSQIIDDLIYFIDGNFVQSNGNTISNGIKIRANNLDSEFYFANVDSLTFYPTLSDRDNNTNPGIVIGSGTSIYRFLYGGPPINGISFSNNIYVRVSVGGTTLLNTTPLTQGSTNIDFGDTGNIQVILNNQKIINQGIQKASKLIPHSTNI